jgi:hypothetical protein
MITSGRLFGVAEPRTSILLPSPPYFSCLVGYLSVAAPYGTCYPFADCSKKHERLSGSWLTILSGSVHCSDEGPISPQ